MTLDYFYGQAGELFSFYRIPKALFQEPRFQSLSTDAKTLYGILLDRMSLSAKNGWLDEQGRVFIIFTIEDVKRALCCADNKATKLLRELEEFGLIERKRRGLGKPSLVYYVVDGQHTIEGRILRNGGKDLPILCKVYTGLTMEQEALFFAEQNGHSAPLTAGIKLRAKVVGGDAPSKAFLAATNRVGLAFNYDSLQLSDYRISCVGTALKLYNQMGEKIYCESLRLIVAAWEGKPDSFRASVLRGVMHFVELYHGEFSEERLIRALGNVHPMEIYRVGRDNPAKLPGWKKYVFPIYMAYNGKGRKDALSMKF